MNHIFEKLKQQKAIIESQGYKVAYICLYGSQNYNLDINTDDYQSDIDMKAIIVPTLDDLINNAKPVSTVIETEWGQCDLKDIRSYFETLLKANPAYIETLFTDYYIIDDDFKVEFEEILSRRESLVFALRAQFIRAMYGMMCEKEKAMCHPYPTIAHKIEKFGYDGKQAHHVYRLWLMMQDYFKYDLPMSECMIPHESKLQGLTRLKLNEYTLVTVSGFVDGTMRDAKEFKDKILESIDVSKIDYSVKLEFEELSKRMIKSKIINEIRSVNK
jgi:predicted nucleotidyltransferase